MADSSAASVRWPQPNTLFWLGPATHRCTFNQVRKMVHEDLGSIADCAIKTYAAEGEMRCYSVKRSDTDPNFIRPDDGVCHWMTWDDASDAAVVGARFKMLGIRDTRDHFDANGQSFRRFCEMYTEFREWVQENYPEWLSASTEDENHTLATA